MAVDFQACSNTGSWDCCTSADNAHMHGYMQIFRVLAVYNQMSYTDFAERVIAQLHLNLSNQFSSAQLVVTVNMPCHNEHLLAHHQQTAQQQLQQQLHSSSYNSSCTAVCFFIYRPQCVRSKTQQSDTSTVP